MQRLDDEMQRKPVRVTVKLMPRKKNIADEKYEEDHVIKHMADLYGFRGCLPEYKDVFYLNAWEFLTIWKIKRLPPHLRAMQSQKAILHR